MSRPTRPQARRPGGRTRPPGPIESAVLQNRTNRVSTVRHVVEPAPADEQQAAAGPAAPKRGAAHRVRAFIESRSTSRSRNRSTSTSRSRATSRNRPWARSVRAASARHWAGGSRAVRRLGWRHWVALVTLLVLVGLAVWAVFFSPLLQVRQVRLVGGERFTQAQLDELTVTELGRPLARVDGDALIEQLRTFAPVRDAQVVRAWPHTLEVRVDERRPVASVPVRAEGSGDDPEGTADPDAEERATDELDRAGGPGGTDEDPAVGTQVPAGPAGSTEGGPGGHELVAGDGVVIERVAQAPEGLPTIDAAVREAGPQTLTSVAAVLAALVPQEEGRVVEAAALSPDSITLVLEVPLRPDPEAADPRAEAEGVRGPAREVTVQWGSAEESALKAEVLSALLQTRADEFDVSAPRTPVTR